MDNEECIEENLMPLKINNDGRDELNLAEFPLCALAHRLRPEQKTLHFEDRVWDERRGQSVCRQLTITGADAYGLPTALDDEVLLGLIQLSKDRAFEERKVSFTRYELIRLLGWRKESKSYQRLEQALNRWTGVTLYYRNAWWNKQTKRWVDEKFHVLERVSLQRREEVFMERGDGEPAEERLSSFVWNEVIFASFQAGNLKSIDFNFFKELRGSVAKRLYRFLDKRFFHRNRWEFDLKELAWEHIGLAHGYDTTNLKRKLCPAIQELEHHGYLRPMAQGDRFRKVRSGQWRVIFEKKTKSAPPVAKTERAVAGTESWVEELIKRGVTAAVARQTAQAFPADRIQTQIRLFDWLVARGDRKVSRNPPGFLVSSIKNQYGPPREYLAEQEKQNQHQQAVLTRQQQEERNRLRAQKEEARLRECDETVNRFWQSLPDLDRARLEQEVLAQATPFQQQLLERGGSLATATRAAILGAYAMKMTD